MNTASIIQSLYYSKFRWLALILRFVCKIITGHRELDGWGYGGGDVVDLWCYWCYQRMSCSKEQAMFRFPEFRDMRHEVDNSN